MIFACLCLRYLPCPWFNVYCLWPSARLLITILPFLWLLCLYLIGMKTCDPDFCLPYWITFAELKSTWTCIQYKNSMTECLATNRMHQVPQGLPVLHRTVLLRTRRFYICNPIEDILYNVSSTSMHTHATKSKKGWNDSAVYLQGLNKELVKELAC